MNDREKREQRNLEVIREIWEGFYNQGDANALLDNVSEDYIWRSDTLDPIPGVVVGGELAVKYTFRIGELLPGVYGQILSLTASGDVVNLFAHVTAQRVNGYMGLPPMDTPIQFHQAMYARLNEDSKVVEQVFFYDRVHILQQLGVLPGVSVLGGAGSEKWPQYIHPRFLYRDPSASLDPHLGLTGLSGQDTLLDRLLGMPMRVLFGRPGQS